MDDRSLTSQRNATPKTHTIQGVAITALSRDDIETRVVGSSSPNIVAVDVSAAGTVARSKTSAYIGDNAQVMATSTVAGGVPSILINAGSDFYHTGISGANFSVGVVGAGSGLELSSVQNETTAFIGKSAVADADGDIQIRALATEDVLSLSGGGAQIGIVGAAG